MTPIIRAMMGRIGSSAARKAAPLSPSSATNAFSMFNGNLEDIGLTPVFPRDKDRLDDAFTQFGGKRAETPTIIDRITDAYEQARQPQPTSTQSQVLTDMGGYAPQQVPNTPTEPGPGLDLPRPKQFEPDADTSPIGFFLRNGMMQRDRDTGDFLDPAMARQAQSAPFSGMFG